MIERRSLTLTIFCFGSKYDFRACARDGRFYPRNRTSAPEERGLTSQLGLQKGSKPDGRDAARLDSREAGAATAERAET
jgi:hypothetical protein